MLKEIISKINEEKNFKKVGDILKEYNDEDWKIYVKTDNNRYCRNKIYENENFEIFIISWNKNQNAPIHDHSCNGCWLKVLQGELIENIYDSESLSLYKSSSIKKNDISFMKNNIGYHSITNNSDETAVTIHIYNPPNHKTKFFV
jgi:cysteine dioxygenase